MNTYPAMNEKIAGLLECVDGEGAATCHYAAARIRELEAALKSEVAAKCSEPGVPATTAGTGAATPSHSLPVSRITSAERTGAQQSQLDTVTPKIGCCCKHYGTGEMICSECINFQFYEPA
jgi:hypothetical protein